MLAAGGVWLKQLNGTSVCEGDGAEVTGRVERIDVWVDIDVVEDEEDGLDVRVVAEGVVTVVVEARGVVVLEGDEETVV